MSSRKEAFDPYVRVVSGWVFSLGTRPFRDGRSIRLTSYSMTHKADHRTVVKRIGDVIEIYEEEKDTHLSFKPHQWKMKEDTRRIIALKSLTGKPEELSTHGGRRRVTITARQRKKGT